jgi:hypothetical protein
MGRYLIVANQTLGGDKLDRAIQARIERGDDRFHILVPMTAPKHEAAAWVDGFPVPEGMTIAQIAEARQVMEEGERRRAAALVEARQRAEHRLGMMIDRIRALGAQVDGEVGDPDPVVAVKEILQDRSFDGIIISTLPARISRWLKMDLPSQVERMTEVPVTTIEADD